MGTRAVTFVKELGLDSNNVVGLYRQFDGYASGHGMDLVSAFKDFKICNGIRSEFENGKYANGMSCLGAQLIAHFKDDIGGFYIYNDKDYDGYCYTLYIDKQPNDKEQPLLRLQAKYGDKIFYDGVIGDFTGDEGDDD